MKGRLAKILPAKAALFVLLAFQLIVGLPLQTAQAALEGRADMRVAMHAKTIAGAQLVAASTPAPIGARMTDASLPWSTTSTATAHADCPMHGAPLTSGGNKHAPIGNHDCCHLSACQCQCVYTPAAFDLPQLADNTTSVVLPSPSSAQFVAPRIDEFLRPPIA